MDDFVPDHIEPDCADYIRSIFLAGAHNLGAGDVPLVVTIC
jgi:hypothetical protein